MAANLGRFAVDMITALGGKPTPQAQKLFRSWQQWEGGWTQNAARFNPLNLTAPGSGLPTINSVGVVAMPSYQAGVKRTADLISSGYPALAAALRSGNVSFQDPSVQADLNRWLSGKRTPGMTPYVSKIARTYGANVPAGAVSPRGTPIPSSPPSLQAPLPQFKTEYSPELFRQKIANAFLTGGGRMDIMSLPGLQRSSQQLVQVPTMRPAAPGAATFPGAEPAGDFAPTKQVKPGKGISLPWQYKATHETDGLQDEGFTRAIDIMARPGTPVSAPRGGTVVYFHPTGAQGGGSMLIRFDDGREGWVGHIDNGLPAGTRFRPGAQLAVVSADHKAPHAHWSLR